MNTPENTTVPSETTDTTANDPDATPAPEQPEHFVPIGRAARRQMDRDRRKGRR